jgi:hypothetical protein
MYNNLVVIDTLLLLFILSLVPVILVLVLLPAHPSVRSYFCSSQREESMSSSSALTLCKNNINIDRLCGLVVRVSGHRSRGPGSIPGPTTLSEK